MLRRAIALAGMAVLTALAAAGPQEIASRNQNIRAGVVILDSAKLSGGQPVSAAPFAFLNLDTSRGVKPAGWSFVNPNAPSVVTPAIAARWGVAPGLKLTKSNAPYWEVFLSASTDASLSNYDVLLVAPRYGVSLSPIERERLRRFVDQGGVLWIDPAAMGAASAPDFGFDPTNNFPLPFGLSRLSSGSVFDQSDPRHPLLSTPNSLSLRDLQLINGNGSLGIRAVDPDSESAADVRPLFLPAIEDFFKLRAVSIDTQGGQTLPTISVGRIGDGFVVVTARGAALNLNGGLSNTGFAAATPSLDASGVASARLAVNLVSLPNEYRGAGGGTRRTNGSIFDVVAPLLKRFEVSNPVVSSPDADLSQPAIWNGMVFISSGDRVYAFDANPSRDIDGDGDPDDGVRDLAGGTGRDLLWESVPLGGLVSAPVVVEVPDVDRAGGSTRPLDQVLVTLTSGRLIVLDAAAPRAGVASSPRSFFFIDPPTGSAGAGNPIPPTAHEGLAFMVDTANGTSGVSGRVWVADLRRGAPVATSANSWSVGGTNAELPKFSASPTVAYIPTADNSGGLDKVLYVPFQAASTGVGVATPGFTSLWLGTRGEKPVDYRADNGQLQVDTRALQAGNLPIYTPAGGAEQLAQGSLGVKLTLLRKVGGVATGDPMPASVMKDVFTGSIDGADGQLKFGLQPGFDANWFDLNVAGIRVDYTIDWGRAITNGMSQTIERGRINLPSQDTGRRILGNLAVTPKGTVFMVISNPTLFGSSANGGSIMAFREDAGRGAFRCTLRYDLFPTHSINPNQGTAVRYRTNFVDQDAVQQFAPALLGGDVQNMVFMGGPSIQGDSVYVLAAGQKSGFFPVDVTVLMSFRAEPELPTIRLNSASDGIQLVQPDMMRSPNQRTPQIFSILSPQNFKYEAETNTIRVENLMTINRGQVQNCLSLSQPVLVRRAGQGDALVEPDKTGGQWSPLQWYTVMHGLQLRTFGSGSRGIVTTPVVAGNTLYLAGTSLMPSIFTNGLTSIPQPSDFRGMCFALNIAIGSNDAFLKPSSDRPWNKQFVQLSQSGSSLRGNSNFVWPSFQGVFGLNPGDPLLVQRINQTVLGSGSSVSNAAFGIVAAQDTAVAWGDGGFYAYNRADVIVADQGRVARFDAAGNVLWTSDATFETGDTGSQSVARVRKLVRPTRAYPVGASDMLIVDTGGNRILRLNAAGVEVRALEGAILDPNYRPDGMAPNAPLTFNAPSDVVTFSEYVDATATPVLSGQTGPELRVHYVVADQGNRRLVDLVDRYRTDTQGRNLGAVTVGGVPQLGVLYWHSPAARSGAGFSYTSLTRVFVPASGSLPQRWLYVAGIGQGTPTRGAVGLDSHGGQPPLPDASGNGGIVVFDPVLPEGSQVFNRYLLPSTESTPFYNESTNSWDTNTPLNGPVGQRPIGSVRSVTVRIDRDGAGNPLARLMVADTNGVFEAPWVAGTTGQELQVGWMLPNAVYRTMRRTGIASAPTSNNAELSAMYAKRLDSGEVLVVNGYFGSTRGTKRPNGTFTGKDSFMGEVVQLDPAFNLASNNLGFFSTTALKYELRQVFNARDITMPVFADRR